MSTCLKIGSLELTGTQVVSALIRYQLLESFVEQIFLDSVLQPITLSKEEVFRALTGGSDAEMPPNFQAFVTAWLKQRNLSQQYLNEVIYRQLRIEKLKRLRFDRYLQSEFLRRKQEFDQVEFSLIQISESALAQELFFQIRDDQAEFGTLAQKYSHGLERQTEGWVGPIKLAKLPPAIAQVLMQGESGGIYGPFEVGTHFWIVRLERLYSARLTESLRTELRDQLFAKWVKMSAQTLLEQETSYQIPKVSESAPERAAESSSQVPLLT
jgi:PPIC-type PPIASE domain